tara:strand:- start:5401 stop:6342 length:942 start_codon:yes stop_codon:yes gene_type:complete
MPPITKHRTLEWVEFAKSQEDKITKKTLDTYFNDYLRFRKEMKDKRTIYNTPQRDIKSIVQNTDYNKRALLNIAIVILKSKDKPIDMLMKYRDDIYNEKQTNQAEKNRNIIKNSQVSYDELISTITDERVGNYVITGIDYILFYLLINFNTRNKDLVIKVISNKNKKELLNKEENFIIVSPNKATLIRNDYKTKSSYGTKKDVIRNLRFNKYIKMELAKDNKALFVNNKNNPYKPYDFSKMISSRFQYYLPEATKLTQAVIYKIITANAHSNGDIKTMKKIADNRGSSLQTQMEQYQSNDYKDGAEDFGSDSD